MTTTNQNEIIKSPDKTFTLNLVVKKDFIQKEYEEILKELKEKFKSPGFREGKTPTDMVEGNLKKEELLKDLIPKVIGKVYGEKIEQYQLKPIIQPKVTIKTSPVDIDTDWEFEIVGAEIPDVKIDKKYEEDIKKFNQENKDKDDKEKQNNGIIEILLKNIEVIERSQIIINKQRITVSEQYKPKFLEFVNQNSLNFD
jgi:FKBP-type peptidyl-prolyl cis-trans isomerase (trigger factor)